MSTAIPTAAVPVPDYAYFFGTLGVALAVSWCAIGSAYATAKGGVALAAISIMRPELVMKSLLPIVMGGIVGIYGLVISILINGYIPKDYTSFKGFAHLSAGVGVGLCGVASGMAIGVITDAGLRAYAQQPKIYIGMIIILVFAEVLGLYGFIVAVLMAVK